MKRLTFLTLAALAACGTPQEQCISCNTRDLRTVDRLIAESEGNLQRGYAYESVTVYEDYWTHCPMPRPPAGEPPPKPRTRISPCSAPCGSLRWQQPFS